MKYIVENLLSPIRLNRDLENILFLLCAEAVSR
jgi:hypothetical protein